MRFEIRREAWARPLLMLIGATHNHSFVDVDEASMRFKFGFFDLTVPRSELEKVESYAWPWWAVALGIRVNLRGGFGLIGAWTGVVKVTFKTPQKVRIGLGFPISCRTLLVSMEEPEPFRAALATGPTA
jgi:hypothetical protein